MRLDTVMHLARAEAGLPNVDAALQVCTLDIAHEVRAEFGDQPQPEVALDRSQDTRLVLFAGAVEDFPACAFSSQV